MTKKEDLEGAVNVEGDVTPITRKPIDKVTAADWNDLPLGDLQAQLMTLQQRKHTALTMGSASLVAALDRGINQLTAIIKSKSKTLDSETRLI